MVGPSIGLKVHTQSPHTRFIRAILGIAGVIHLVAIVWVRRGRRTNRRIAGIGNRGGEMQRSAQWEHNHSALVKAFPLDTIAVGLHHNFAYRAATVFDRQRASDNIMLAATVLQLGIQGIDTVRWRIGTKVNPTVVVKVPASSFGIATIIYFF